MITRLPPRGVMIAAIAFVLASVSLTLFVWRSVGGPTPFEPRQFEIRARFDNAGQLTKNADVRISGVNVGKVVKVRPSGLRTEATMAIDARYAPLPSDVRVILRQKTLLGETFVAMTPGSRDAPKLREGDALPVSQVEATQPLDRVLGTFDRPTREKMVELLTNGATLLDGRGEDVNAAVGNMADGTRELAAITRILDGQRPAVEQLVRDGGVALRTVGAEQTGLDRLVRAGHRALSATASRDRELTATVREAPGLLRELRAASAAVTRTARTGAPTVRALRRTAPQLAPTLSSVRDTSPQLRRVLRDTGALVPTARRALPATGAIVDALSPLVSALAPAAAEVAPVISYVGEYDKELVATMANVSASTNGTSKASDGTQKPYLRTLTLHTLETVVGYDRRLGSNRHNAYRAPGGLADLAKGLASSNCAHAGSTGEEAPPCRVQEGWRLGDQPPRYFQRLEAAKPGGPVVRALRRAFSL